MKYGDNSGIQEYNIIKVVELLKFMKMQSPWSSWKAAEQ